jgi:CHASE3 domain sensor protein
MLKNLSARGKIILSLILIITLLIGYAVYRDLHKTQVVTGESQTQAETPAGVDLAAQNASVTLEMLDKPKR